MKDAINQVLASSTQLGVHVRQAPLNQKFDAGRSAIEVADYREVQGCRQTHLESQDLIRMLDTRNNHLDRLVVRVLA
jgi:hypothetical protein